MKITPEYLKEHGVLVKEYKAVGGTYHLTATLIDENVTYTEALQNYNRKIIKVQINFRSKKSKSKAPYESHDVREYGLFNIWHSWGKFGWCAKKGEESGE